MILRDAGLIHDNDSLHAVLKVLPTPTKKSSILALGDQMYMISQKGNQVVTEYRIPQVHFTVAGKEICALLKIKNNPKYIEALLSELEKKYELTKFDLNELLKQAESAQKQGNEVS